MVLVIVIGYIVYFKSVLKSPQAKQPPFEQICPASLLQEFEDLGALPRHSLERAFGQAIDAGEADGNPDGIVAPPEPANEDAEKLSSETTSFLLAYGRLGTAHKIQLI